MEFEKIRDVIAEQIDIDKDSITLETALLGNPKADSMDVTLIVYELEDIFGMKFANEDAKNIRTVGDVVQYVQEALKKKQNEGI